MFNIGRIVRGVRPLAKWVYIDIQKNKISSASGVSDLDNAGS